MRRLHGSNFIPHAANSKSFLLPRPRRPWPYRSPELPRSKVHICDLPPLPRLVTEAPRYPPLSFPHVLGARGDSNRSLQFRRSEQAQISRPRAKLLSLREQDLRNQPRLTHPGEGSLMRGGKQLRTHRADLRCRVAVRYDCLLNCIDSN